MAENNISKNRVSGGKDSKYSYKYTDIAQIHEYLESKSITYYQYIEPENGNDYVMTVPIIEGKELAPRRGCRVTDATLVGISNPAQEQGSAITYARRYSLLMAFGLATEDDDAQSLSKPKNAPKVETIGEAHIKTIKAELARTGVTETAFLKTMKVNNIDSMNIQQFTSAMSALKQYPDKNASAPFADPNNGEGK